MDFQNKTQIKQAVKFFFVVLLSLFLLIPLSFLSSSIKERERNAEYTIDEVGSTWGGRQSIMGPYIEGNHETKDASDGKMTVTRESLFPEVLDMQVNMQSSVLKKSIYKIPVYSSTATITGIFKIPEELDYLAADGADAKLVIGVGDLKGIADQAEVMLDGHRLSCTNRNMAEGNYPEIVADIPAGMLVGKDSLTYSIDLHLKGAAEFKVAPVGAMSEVRIVSDYPDPSFNGNYIPAERTVSDDGFSATWKINAINRDYPQHNERAGLYESVENSVFGVDLFVPVSQYQQSERAIKYALLVILLTMLAIFLMEIWTGKSVNYLQYILTGADLVIFYSLLFSLSEHIGFSLAFLTAAALTILLMVLYMKSVLDSWGRALGLGALASLLYAYIFILLRMGDFAFLAGSIGLFILLALVMHFSQKAFGAKA